MVGAGRKKKLNLSDMEDLLFADLSELNLGTVERRSIEKLRRDLGPTILEALQDDSVTDIMLNPNGSIWIENREGMQEIGSMVEGYSETLIKMVASCVKEEVNSNNPVLECELPWNGSRFEGLLPPAVARPTISIRKHSADIYTLQDYVDSKILSTAQRDVIEQSVIARKNILVAGSTGSGKTTFTNAIIKATECSGQDHRIIVIEDTNELQVSNKLNNVVMRCGLNFSMLQALKVTMRMRPDRIIVGEVRGGEALTLLKSWNTGHSGGVCTLHANSARAALIRLEQLISEASVQPMQTLIAEAIDLIVFIERSDTHESGRVIKEIVHLDGYTSGEYQLSNI